MKKQKDLVLSLSDGNMSRKSTYRSLMMGTRDTPTPVANMAKLRIGDLKQPRSQPSVLPSARRERSAARSTSLSTKSKSLDTNMSTTKSILKSKEYSHARKHNSVLKGTKSKPSENSYMFAQYKMENNQQMFDPTNVEHFTKQTQALQKTNEPTLEGLTFDVVADWSRKDLKTLLAQPKGKQLFRYFLESNYAEENLLFYEGVDEMKNATTAEEKLTIGRKLCADIVQGLNMNTGKKQSLIDTTLSLEAFDMDEWARLQREIYKLMSDERYGEFTRSEIYINYLEKLMMPDDVKKWSKSLNELLFNPVGRWRFRRFLRKNHAEENLRFLEAVGDYVACQDGNVARKNMAKSIAKHYLETGASNEVAVESKDRKEIEEALKNDKTDYDEHFFDQTVRAVKVMLRRDPYVRFMESEEYRLLKANIDEKNKLCDLKNFSDED